jgi:autotransporter-associated beta strand protein
MLSLRSLSQRLFVRQNAVSGPKRLAQWKPTLEPLEELCLLYSFFGGTWSQPDGPGTPVNVTYSYSNLFDGGLTLGSGVTNYTLVRAVEEALSLWARYAPFNFTEVPDPGGPIDDGGSTGGGQIRLGHHALDGSTLAHAFGPGGGLGGDVHFDDSNRTWSTTLFLETATHELGHSLGLGHSTLNSPRVDAVGASGPPIMYPSILGRYDGLGSAFLFQDDVNGIRARYGTGSGEVITTRVWQGGTGNWSTAAGWNPNFEPTGNSDVIIDGNQTVTVSSGTRAARIVWPGFASGQTGTLNVSAGGTLNVKYYLAVGTNGTGIVNLSGGTINSAGINFGGNSAALLPVVNITGGALNLTGPINDGTGTSTLQISNGTLNLNNNAVAVERFIVNGGSLLNLNGPVTVKNLLQLGNVTLAIPNITLQGGLTLDPAGFGVAVVNSNLNLSGAVRNFTIANIDPVNNDLVVFGNITNGGVRKLGPGAMVVSANQAYTGITDIAEGVLIINGSIASSSTTIAGGATLTGATTLNGLVSNGFLSPGNSAGTTTVNGNFTQNATGQVNIELGGATAGVNHDVVQVNGSASLGGTLNISLLDAFQPTPGATFDVLRANSIALNGLTLTGPDAGNFSTSVVTVGSQQVLRLTANLPPGAIIDDGDAGFANTGFTLFVGQGFANDVRYSAAGSGNTATWTFNVAPGQYRVAASWSSHPNRATNSPFTVLDGANPLDTVLVNQELAPNDFFAAGSPWKLLGGPYTVTGSTLTVLLSDRADEYVIADAIRIEQIFVNPVQTVDDGDAGFTATGGFTSFPNQGLGNDVRFAGAGTGGSAATWSFSVVPGGVYKVFITWTAHPNRATNSPFTVLGGATALGTYEVNQELAPSDFNALGVGWKELGTFALTDNSLVVRLTDQADEYVIADAVRIERIA